MANSTLQDVFRFTSLRAPKTPDEEKWYLKYAKDNFFSYLEKIEWVDRDWKDGNVSSIGSKIFDLVFCSRDKKQEDIVDEILELNGFGRKEIVRCIVQVGEGVGSKTVKTISGLATKTEYCFSEEKEAGTPKEKKLYTWFLTHSIPAITERLDLASRIIQTHLVNFNKKKLICQLQTALEVNNLSEFVLSVNSENGRIAQGAGNSDQFKHIKGKLFDLLYCLYISKRRLPINLDHIIRQIQTLHVIEFLAYDDFVRDYKQERQRQGCNLILSWLYRLFNSKTTNQPKMMVSGNSLIKPSLVGISNACDISEFTTVGIFTQQLYINSKEDLIAFFNVTPIIPPICSTLKVNQPTFNNIRPVGICDLKIVKQILVGYEAGEVAHIENVLKGENKEKIHRRLDTIETFISDETTRENETNRETQTTDRNEIQRESERTINEALNFNTDASVHYNGGTIDATLNAGFSWDRSTEESNRNASNFAKEVIQKSAERIMQRAQSLRTNRRTSETEETNRHGLNNVGGNTHVRGVYRYVNKRYKAQVFNYGKRLMFEFLIPEPSEFYKKTIENKNKYKSGNELDCSRSKIPTLEENKINDKNGITKKIVEDYAKLLITTFEYPYTKDVAKTETIYMKAGKLEVQGDNPWTPGDESVNQPEFIKSKTNQTNERDRLINEMKISKDLDGAKAQADLKTFTPGLGTLINIHADVFTTGHRGHDKNPQEQSTVYLEVKEIPNSVQIIPSTFIHSVTEFSHDFPTISNNQNASLTFEANCDWCQYYFIVLTIAQTEDPSEIDKWKSKVFDDLKAKIDEKNKEIDAFCADEKTKFNSKQKIDDEASFIRIKGKHPAINKTIIQEELHKHAISMFALEFDPDKTEDLLLDNPIEYKVETIVKNRRADKKKDTNICDEKVIEDTECRVFPVINVDLARKKGEVVQFLEQAFEWDKMSYILYPYFYGDKSRWMETFDHYDNDDQNDTAFVAFLRAGYARVLVPVRDTYRDAVPHFLSTRKPWNGGSAPVIGDNLYLPIHEEIRNQTDEYYKAQPVGEAWEYVLPTSLIYLQEDGNLPVFESEFPTNK